MSEFTNLILVVDDEESIRETAAVILRMKGYEVVTAEDGLSALEVLSKSRPYILVSDLKMPRMDGFELLSVVRQRFPEIGVIVISGEYVSAFPSGNLMTDAFFAKGNYERDELFQMIAALIGQYPIRKPHINIEIAPVWIPRHSLDLVLTCTHCLRSFSVAHSKIANSESIQQIPCPSCERAVPFQLEPEALQRIAQRKNSAAGK